MIGQQMGARAQVSVLQRENWIFVAEGFYGALLTKFDSSESAGGGGRAYFRRCSQDGRNSMLLGPGLNLFYEFHEGGLPVLAPSLDLSWLHGFCGGGWEIGLSLGVGISLKDKHEGRDVNAGEVTPLISAFTGFRF